MRLGTRLFLLVVCSSLLPAALVLLAGWVQLREQVRLWTIPSVEAALDASLHANRRAFDRLQRHLEVEGKVLAESSVFPPAPADTMGLAEVLDAGVRQFGIDVAQFYTYEESGFRLLVSRTLAGEGGANLSKRLRVPVPSTTGPERPSALRLGDPEGDLLLVPTFLWTPGAPEPGVRGALVLGISLGPRYYERLTEVSTGLLYYRRLEEFGRVLRSGYAILAALVLLGSALLSLWIARRVARSVSRPVEDLIRRMDAVGRGDAPIAFGSQLDLAAPSPPIPSPERIPEMARLSDAFESMRSTLREYEERLRESERVRATQETARFVAHEIRNTLTPIRAGLTVLARQIERMDTVTTSARALDLIRREADRMAALAGAFSEYARFPDRKPRRFDLAARVDAIARAEVPSGVALDIERPPELPDVHADVDEMERLFRNLIRNAVEATASDTTQAITASDAPAGATPRIRIAFAAASQTRLSVVIEDNGSGMDAETLRKAFQPGFTTKPTGSGLGLALVRRSVTYYGGTLRLESSPDRGTRILIELPALPAEPWMSFNAAPDVAGPREDASGTASSSVGAPEAAASRGDTVDAADAAHTLDAVDTVDAGDAADAADAAHTVDAADADPPPPVPDPQTIDLDGKPQR